MMGEEEPIFVIREEEKWYSFKTVIMKNMMKLEIKYGLISRAMK
jgi:hypothetical protein